MSPPCSYRLHPAHIAVPFLTGADLVVPGDGLREMPQHAGAGERLAVDRDKPGADRLEALVEVDADRDTFQAIRIGPEAGDVLLPVLGAHLVL